MVSEEATQRIMQKTDMNYKSNILNICFQYM